MSATRAPLAFAAGVTLIAITVAVTAAHDDTDRHAAAAETTPLVITAPASAEMPAEPVVPRTTTTATTTIVAVAEPPVPGVAGTAIEGRCSQYEPLLLEWSPPGGWDVARMSGYLWRESRCEPTARSRTRDSGIAQLNDVNLPFLSGVFGVSITAELLFDPVWNIRGAAALCTYWRNAGSSCYRPWGGS